MSNIAAIRSRIANHESNAWARKLGYQPLFTASAESRIAIIGQAPGRKAQDSQIPWDDPSGNKLREWLGVTNDQFNNEKLFAIIPMDFYYPGKGKTGDLPPRKEFAEMWHPKLLAEMPKLELTILIGAYAQKYYLGGRQKRNLTETVRSYAEYLPELLPLVHPSPLNARWQAKNPWFTSEVLPELRKVVAGLIADGA